MVLIASLWCVILVVEVVLTYVGWVAVLCVFRVCRLSCFDEWVGVVVSGVCVGVGSSWCCCGDYVFGAMRLL